MDLDLHIEGVKSQLDSMKLLIENIEMQKNAVMNPMMVNPIEDQLLNLSIQMIHYGIQTFNIFIKRTMNIYNFHEKLKKISEQINNILYSTSHQMIMQQPIMMNHKMDFQQMMQQQMNVQKMNQQPIPMEVNISTQKLNVIFVYMGKSSNIIVDETISVKELIDKYMIEKFGYENNNLRFLFNGIIINRYNMINIKEFLRNNLCVCFNTIKINVVD